MRVSSTMMIDNYLTQTNNVYEQQTKLMEQSDGSKLHRPSDDAIGYSKYLRYSDSKAENNQYQENVKTGLSWMKNTDSAMVDMTDRLKTIVDKTMQAANDTNTEDDMRALSKEILGAVQQVVSDGNTQVNGRYLFSGQADLTQPFVTSVEEKDRGVIKFLDEKQAEFFNKVTQFLTLKDEEGNEYYLNTRTGDYYTRDFVQEGYKDVIISGSATVRPGDAAGKLALGTDFVGISEYFDNMGVINDDGKAWTGDYSGKELKLATITQTVVTYKGDTKHISMTKENGQQDQTSDTVNVNGLDLCGTDLFDDKFSGNKQSGSAMMNNLYALVKRVESGDSRWLQTDGVTVSNNAHDDVVISETKLAARSQVYTDVKSMLEDRALTVTGDISEIADTDVAQLSVLLNTITTIYSMSLAVGSRVLPMSLADYL
ncbi:MAG: flagellar hook-associated protein FlgL [Selenomonadaceae bacterium]|nr:flagellar hook-associated protein FlgL [Selenomonadaceae bacterium]